MVKELKTAVLLGDSLTEWGDFSPLSYLVKVINLGISGDTTMGILSRVEKCAERHPDYIFLLAGINDILQHERIEDIVVRHRKIWAKIKERSPGTKLVVLTLIPVCEQLLDCVSEMTNNKRILILNGALKKFAADDGVRILDLGEDYYKENGDIGLSPVDTEDGLHLRPAGYRPWIRMLLKYLALED